MDNGLYNGLYTNTPEGVHNGIYTGTNNGVFNGVFNEGIIEDKILKDGLILYVDTKFTKSYPRGGNNINDLSKKSNNGTLINNPVYSPINNGCIELLNPTSSGKYIDFKDKDIFTFGSGVGGIDIPFSFSLWIYPTSFSTNGIILFGRSYNTPANAWQREYLTSIGPSGNVNFSIFNPDISGGNSLVNSTTSTISTNKWVNLTFTYNANKLNSGMLTYVNGVLQSTTSSNGGTYTGMGNTDAPLYFGFQYFGSNPSLSALYYGYLAQILLYRNKVLTAAEINQNYQATKSRFNL